MAKCTNSASGKERNETQNSADTNKTFSKNNNNNNNNRGKKWNKGKRNFNNNDKRGATSAKSGVNSSFAPKAGENDISWYSKNPQLLLAAGAFPYPYRPGMQFDAASVWNWSSTANTPPIDYTFQVPGVLALEWIPSIGQSRLATDPASVTAKQIYARVRAAYSGELSVDAPDFMMYLLALDSVFSYIAAMKRIYRTLNAYTIQNHILPDRVLSAMGISASMAVYLRQNMTRFWQAINTLVLQSRQFTCPAIMDVFNRHYWMSDNVYLDAPMLNAQMYVFKQQGYYIFNELPVDEAGNLASGLSLMPTPFDNTDPRNNVDEVNAFYGFGVNLLTSLIQWDEAYTINGYLQRAYEGTGSFVVEEIPQSEVLVPVYVEEVLMQIENSRTIPYYAYVETQYEGNLEITQDVTTNAILCDLNLVVKDVSTATNQTNKIMEINEMISMRSDAPTVADNVIATRLHAVCATVPEVVDNTIEVTIVPSVGTEIPLQWKVVGDNGEFATLQDIVTDGDFDIPAFESLIALIELEAFDWHPFFWVAYNQQMFPLGDVHNITNISKRTLENLHRICLYSEFNSFPTN